MRPERLDHRSGKGLVIVHRCVQCGFARANRLATDVAQADDVGALTGLMSWAAPASTRSLMSSARRTRRPGPGTAISL
jgi:hypothetical protein